MRKIALIRTIVAIACMTYALLILYNIYFIFFQNKYHLPGWYERQRIRDAYLSIATFLTVIIASINIVKALNKVLRFGYFDSDTAKRIRTAGILLISSGIIQLFGMLFIHYATDNKYHRNLFAILTDVLSTPLIGFGLIVIADFIKKGAIIEQENQLTI